MSTVVSCQMVRLVRWSVGLKTLTSKNAHSNQPPQKPLALMSNLASSPQMLVLMDNTSPVRGCRGGSIVTSLHTSFSRSAVISRSSSWRMDGYPPVGQDSACAIVNNCPQTHLRQALVVTNRTAGTGHHSTLPYAG